MLNNWNASPTLANLANLGIVIYLVFYILSIGQTFIIPFLLALFLTGFIVAIASFFNKHVRNAPLSYFFSVFSLFIIFYFISKIFTSNYSQLLEVAPTYQSKVVWFLQSLSTEYPAFKNINFDTIIWYINIPTLVSYFGNAITSFLSNTSIVLIYTLLFLLEYRYIKEKMILLVWRSTHENQILLTVHQIREDISSYFLYKSMVSGTIALLSYVVMFAVGLDFAGFWAFMIFILDFIPNIWSLLAMIFPIAFGFVQFDSLTLPIINAIGIIGVQMIMSNIVEPKVMGNRLNLSSLVIMLSLGFWGILWWGIGMLLAMPIMVSLNIVLSKFEATKWIAVLMSEKWEIKTDFTFDTQKSVPKKFFTKVKEKIIKK